MSIFSGLGNALSGGAQGLAAGAEPGIEMMEKGEIAKQLAQQTSNLRVQAEQQIQQNQMEMMHGEQARVGQITTAGGTDLPGQMSTTTAPAGPAAPTGTPGFLAANPVTPAAPSLLGGAGGPSLLGGAGGPSLLGGAGGPAEGGGTQQPEGLGTTSGAPTPPTPTSTGTTDTGGWLNRAQNRLVQAGMPEKAAELAKLNQFRVAGSAWGKQVLYNEQTGEYKVLDETGTTREASAEEVAKIRAGGSASRSGAATMAALEKVAPPAMAFEMGDPLFGKPNMQIHSAFQQTAFRLAGKGVDPYDAAAQAGEDIEGVARSAYTEAQAKLPNLPKSDPKFQEAFSQIFNTKLNRYRNPGAAKAGNPGVAGQPPAAGVQSSPIPGGSAASSPSAAPVQLQHGQPLEDYIRQSALGRVFGYTPTQPQTLGEYGTGLINAAQGK